MNDDVIICRCEDLTFGEVREWIDKGYTTYEEIKRITRTGMGPCQGKTCKEKVLKELAKAKNVSMDELDKGVERAPLQPVKLEKLSRGSLEEK